jgi:hypothetical protein
MAFLYRFAITITRRQPYVDWANSCQDGLALTEELAHDQRTIFLAPETTDEPDGPRMLEEFWEQIFEQELSAWTMSAEQWPAPLTREMFDTWFGAEITSCVYDLTPDEPLTQTDLELVELDAALHHCAWCDAELEDHAGHFVAFAVGDRTALAHRAGLVVPIRIDDERLVIGVISPEDSDAARAGEDVAFRACTSRCEKALRKFVPKALKRAFKQIDHAG